MWQLEVGLAGAERPPQREAGGGKSTWGASRKSGVSGKAERLLGFAPRGGSEPWRSLRNPQGTRGLRKANSGLCHCHKVTHRSGCKLLYMKKRNPVFQERLELRFCGNLRIFVKLPVIQQRVSAAPPCQHVGASPRPARPSVVGVSFCSVAPVGVPGWERNGNTTYKVPNRETEARQARVTPGI